LAEFEHRRFPPHPTPIVACADPSDRSGRPADPSLSFGKLLVGPANRRTGGTQGHALVEGDGLYPLLALISAVNAQTE
jgi:hypothetical protein